MEIERKFKIKKLPELSGYVCNHIEQGYLNKTPVVRIRQRNQDYILTYKSRIGHNNDEIAICDEVELPLTKESYLHLRSKVDDNVITKKRYLIPLYDGLVAELDIFEGKLAGLCVVEVEFGSEEEAKGFVLPDWFGEDVSSQKFYRNSFLSTVESFENIQELM